MKSSTVVNIGYLTLTLLIGVILGSWLEYKIHNKFIIITYSPNKVEHFHTLLIEDDSVVIDSRYYFINNAEIQLTRNSFVTNKQQICLHERDLNLYEIDSVGYCVQQRTVYKKSNLVSSTLDTIFINSNTNIKQVKL